MYFEGFDLPGFWEESDYAQEAYTEASPTDVLIAEIEAELAAIAPLSLAMRKLLSAEGFADYYFEMQDLYPSQLEAYERLEDFHINVTGHRRYAEFDSFRKVLERRMKKIRLSRK